MPGSPVDAGGVVAALRAAGCVFAEDEARLLLDAAGTPSELDELLTRRVAGEPLEHLLGWAEFAGLRVHVAPGVFVPRRRSELLVREALGHLRRARSRGAATGGPPVVVDLCCGSGAVGLAVAAATGPVELHAADVDPVAVRCARRNVEPAGGSVHEGDLYAALPPVLRGRVDVLVVNAPYVPTGEIALMPAEARDHEPLVALDGGSDGLDVQRRVVTGAPHWLSPRGCLLVETSERQAPLSLAAFTAAGLVARVVSSDEFDATAVVGVPA